MKSLTLVVQNLLKPYIDNHDDAVAENIAPVETDETSASQSYAIGKQLILDGTLYDVIAAINAGDALVVNTNISRADDISDTISSISANVVDKADKDVIDTEYEAIGSEALYPHAEGHKFYATNGKMYRASTDIAVGDTLTVGTNCALDNVIESFNDVLDVTSDQQSDISDLTDAVGTTTVKTLAANATSISFDVPTTGDNLVDFFISDGSSYTAIDTSVAGTVTLTFDAVASARTVSCRIGKA